MVGRGKGGEENARVGGNCPTSYTPPYADRSPSRTSSDRVSESVYACRTRVDSSIALLIHLQRRRRAWYDNPMSRRTVISRRAFRRVKGHDRARTAQRQGSRMVRGGWSERTYPYWPSMGDERVHPESNISEDFHKTDRLVDISKGGRGRLGRPSGRHTGSYRQSFFLVFEECGNDLLRCLFSSTVFVGSSVSTIMKAPSYAPKTA